jgi:scyllo-inositol 2-dehydrogenase (NADP+)
VTLRVGIVGTGWVGLARHLPSYRSHPDVDVVAVYDRRPERAAEVANEYSIASADADVESFLGRGLDVVSIATPPWTHAELAAQALGAGVHVFTEKPMAMDSAEAQTMVEAADRAERLLCVSHNFLYSRAVAKAKAFIGASPMIYAAGIQLSSLRRRLPSWYEDLPGGLLFDEMPHLIYLLQAFLGSLRVEFVRKTSASDPGSAVEVLLAGERGPGQLMMVLDTPVSEWQIVLVTSRGVVALDLFRDIAVRVGSDRGHKAFDILRTSTKVVSDHVAGFVASGSRYVPGRLFWGHDVLIRAFIDAVVQGRPSPVTAESALGVVRAADDIVRALASEASG